MNAVLDGQRGAQRHIEDPLRHLLQSYGSDEAEPEGERAHRFSAGCVLYDYSLKCRPKVSTTLLYRSAARTLGSIRELCRSWSWLKSQGIGTGRRRMDVR